LNSWTFGSAAKLNDGRLLFVAQSQQGFQNPYADFLAGANLDNGDPETSLFSMTRFFKLLPGEQRQAFLGGLEEKA
jgi:hypothetical protein